MKRFKPTHKRLEAVCILWIFDGLQVCLTESLTWHYWQTRLEAAKALGKLEGPIPRTTLDLLLELCNDRSSSAVREAVEALLAREADILKVLPPS